ncbi:MAG: homoserine dehydrogenase [Candidatus Altiarchaeales archaeon HGW-Altiarchaeales-3]|nr:MAG: homoserine dehydrogenase [Candidatus Altiarchaeales archaeon HGW-Altiarchaeales-3]
MGRGFCDVLARKKKFINEKFNINLEIAAICEFNGSIVNPSGISVPDIKKLIACEIKLSDHKNWTAMKSTDVLREIDADIAVELTPGNIKTGEPGLGHIIAALENKKHVVTSNKAPIAIQFHELMALAQKNNLKLNYEAAVGGAVPIINLYRETLQINNINSIYGILNGTTNYILTKMTMDDITFDAALKEAQDLGFAETDPTYDIEGIDTAVKVVILANSLMNKTVKFEDVKVTGIKDITPEAIDSAKKNGFVIKLIGDVEKLEVSPRLVPKSSPLNVDGTLNAIMLETDIAEDITIIGRGAGAKETSSALFSDVLSICKELL